MGLLAARRIRARVQGDFDHLLNRMRQRWYPETKPALAFYWLKTVFASGYELEHWRFLDKLLNRYGSPDPSLVQLQTWIHEEGLLSKREQPGAVSAVPKPDTPTRDPGPLLPFTVRLLNEWLPKEVARLLIAEPDQPGIPCIALARALERILLREQLASATLLRMLDHKLSSPHLVYAAYYEILRDVLLYLLGQTDAPSAPVLPAALLFTAPDASFSADYGEAVRRAWLEQDDLCVPIEPAQAARILREDQVRITSAAVTMDGRLWQAYKLRSGDRNLVLYRPMGLLRIDDSGEHSRIGVRWPEARFRWSGEVSFQQTFEIFGRRWAIEKWDQDAKQTWVTLAFVGILSAPASAEEDRQKRKPAWVDMDWAALQSALVDACSKKDLDPIGRLRREELIPLGRALYALWESLTHWPRPATADTETRLRAVAFHAGQIALSHGKVPWHVLPASLQRGLLRPRSQRVLAVLLNEVFEGLPESVAAPRAA